MIKKFLPKGWVLPINFTAKPIQINGRSAFVTLMLPVEDWNNETAATSPREQLGTVVYFMNADQQVVTNATAYWPKHGASAEQVLSFAKSHLPAGYELAYGWHAQATQDRPTAVIVKVSKRSNTVATQTSADHVEKQLAFAPLGLLIAGLGMLGLGADRRRKRH
ncbi:MAG: hypothetical protein LKG31_03965 [Lactobacillus sp.]|nr:hypothetical protein [Lactobacillus sp.]MCI1482091.1 hypothetical protein [Lactobacillus sp.]